MPMMSELIDAYCQDPHDKATSAALLDALIATGPLRHDSLRWQAAYGQILDIYAYWWGYEDIPAAADTPIPR